MDDKDENSYRFFGIALLATSMAVLITIFVMILHIGPSEKGVIKILSVISLLPLFVAVTGLMMSIYRASFFEVMWDKFSKERPTKAQVHHALICFVLMILYVLTLKKLVFSPMW